MKTLKALRKPAEAPLPEKKNLTAVGRPPLLENQIRRTISNTSLLFTIRYSLSRRTAAFPPPLPNGRGFFFLQSRKSKQKIFLSFVKNDLCNLPISGRGVLEVLNENSESGGKNSVFFRNQIYNRAFLVYYYVEHRCTFQPAGILQSMGGMSVFRKTCQPKPI